MGFLINQDDLLSRTMRINQIAQDFDNLLGTDTQGTITRVIDSAIRFSDQFDEENNLIDVFFKIGQNAVGFLVKLVKGIVVSAVQIVSWARSTFEFIVNFDWNASDQSLVTAMQNANLQLANIWGGFIGEVLGTAAGVGAGYLITIGIGRALDMVLPGLGILLTPQLAKAVSLETLRERIPEILDSLKIALIQSTGILLRNLAVSSYIIMRRILKRLFPEQLANWGTGPRWTIAESFSNWLSNITGNEMIDQAAEEAAEEFNDAFWETGFVFANELDYQLKQAKLMKDQVLGEKINQAIIELDPDTEEQIILPNQPSNLAQIAIVSEISQYRKIRNRDIGMFTGERLRDNISKVKPPLTLLLQWAYYEVPPFRRGDKALRYCEIPFVKRSKLDFNTIKIAMGGSNGYQWGRFKAYATLLDSLGNKVSPVKLYGGTAEEVEERLRALISLTECEIATFSVTEELREGRKANGRALYKETARIYPAYMTLINTQKVLNEENGLTELTGTYRKQKDRIEMWTTDAPPDFDTIINNILTVSGLNI